MVKIHIVNKIENKVNEYIEKTGASKTWLARKIGYKSKQAMDGAMISQNPTLKTLILFADFFNCDIKDLFDVNIDR